MRESGRPEPPLDGDETQTLLGFLDYQRATLEWRCTGLDSDGLAATTTASNLTLGGLLKHMAFVEDEWILRWLPGADQVEPWASVDWEVDRDWDFTSARDDTPEELFAQWRLSIKRSRTGIGEALADGGLSLMAKRSWPDGRAPSLRWILVHLIEEYARHNGHADFLRESFDGQTGE
jgi:uncharacterized damage-inducible protein DinB